MSDIDYQKEEVKHNQLVAHAFTIHHDIARLEVVHAHNKDVSKISNLRPSHSMPSQMVQHTDTVKSEKEFQRHVLAGDKALLNKSIELIANDFDHDSVPLVHMSKSSISFQKYAGSTARKSNPSIPELHALKLEAEAEKEAALSPLLDERIRRSSIKDGIKKIAKDVTRLFLRKNRSLSTLLAEKIPKSADGGRRASNKDIGESQQQRKISSKPGEGSIAGQRRQSAIGKDIDHYLKQEKAKYKAAKSEPKVLILGSQNSGKSTFLKQICLYNGVGITSEEKEAAKTRILKGIFSALHCLLSILDDEKQMEAVKQESVEELSEDNSATRSNTSYRRYIGMHIHSKTASSLSSISAQFNDLKAYCASYASVENGVVPLDIKVIMLVCVREPAFCFLLEEGQSFHKLPENTGFFLRPEKLEKCLSPLYVPTSHDVIMSKQDLLRPEKVKAPTQDANMSKHDSGDAPHEIVIDIKASSSPNLKYHFIDTSCSLYSKKSVLNTKIPVFDEVNTIIFLVSLTSFDMQAEDDFTKNQMAESLVVFDQLLDRKLFIEQKTQIWLIFTRKDLFSQKAGRISLKRHFPHYGGPDFDSRHYYDFIKRMFLKNAGSRLINTRAISAVDPDSCKPVISDLQNAIGESKNRMVL